MAKTKTQRQKFYTEGELLKDPTLKTKAPVVGGEFVTEDKEWQGQTVEVQSDKHLEDDLGTGEPVIIRTYIFAANPLVFQSYRPTTQAIFDSHKKGIEAMLWQDGLKPAEDVSPQVTFMKDGKQYMVTIAARPQMGQAVLEKTQTLSELVNGSRPNPN